MKNALLSLLLVFGSLPLVAQWTEVSSPDILYTYDLENVDGAFWLAADQVYTSPDPLTTPWEKHPAFEFLDLVHDIEQVGDSVYIAYSNKPYFVDNLGIGFHTGILIYDIMEDIVVDTLTFQIGPDHVDDLVEMERFDIEVLDDRIFVFYDEFDYGNDGILVYDATAAAFVKIHEGLPYQYRNSFKYGDYIYSTEANDGGLVRFNSALEKESVAPLQGQLAILDSNNWVCFGPGNQLFRSVDQGANWDSIPLPLEVFFLSMEVFDNGIISFSQGSSLETYSLDGGYTWLEATDDFSWESRLKRVNGVDFHYNDFKIEIITCHEPLRTVDVRHGLSNINVRQLSANHSDEFYAFSRFASSYSVPGTDDWRTFRDGSYTIYGLTLEDRSFYARSFGKYGPGIYMETAADTTKVLPLIGYDLCYVDSVVYAFGRTVYGSSDLGETWTPVADLRGYLSNNETVSEVVHTGQNWLIQTSYRLLIGEDLEHLQEHRSSNFNQLLAFPNGNVFATKIQGRGSLVFYGSNNHGVDFDYIAPDFPSGMTVDTYTDIWEVVRYKNVLVTTGNYAFHPDVRENLFFSYDYGHTWTSDVSGLPDDFVTGAFVANHKLYVSTDGRLFCYNDSTVTTNVRVFADADGSGDFSSGDFWLPNQLVESEFAITRTNNDGVSALLTSVLGDTVRVHSDLPHIAIYPPHYFIDSTVTDTLVFGVQLDDSPADVHIDGTLLEELRPGFSNRLFAIFENKGALSAGGECSIRLPAGVSMTGSIPAPVQQFGDSLFFGNLNLRPGERQQIRLSLQASADLPLYNEVLFTGHFEHLAPTTSGTHVWDTLSTTVVGAYDPNNKYVVPAGSILAKDIAQRLPLKYTIRFQNTGTFLAENVRITDTLARNLDWSTMEVLNFSHPMTWKINGNGELGFSFDHINLPDSTTNFDESQGFVTYQITPSKSLQIGDAITNRAFIYFDFNEPIETGTVRTEVVQVVHTIEVGEQLTALLVPNPTRGPFRVQLSQKLDTPAEALLLNINGQPVDRKTVQVGEQLEFDLSEAPAGTYFVLIRTSGAQTSTRIIKK